MLDTPFTLKNVRVKNRFLRSATMEYMADINGHVTDDVLKLYYDLARGGAGIIVTGCAAVQENGRAWAHQLGVWNDEFIPGLENLAKVIHTYGDGCVCAVQLAHQGTAGYGYSYGAIDQGYSLTEVDERDIIISINAFGVAAARVKAAGFDAVAVHGAHGYLVSEFLSPLTNNRTDSWGGNPDNRMRFPLEVIKSIRSHVGPDFPILWKMNTSDFLEGGAERDEYAEAAKRIAGAGVDLIEMSGGIKNQIELRARLRKQAGENEAYFADAVSGFRKALGTRPLALTGGIRSLIIMKRVLEGGVDFVGLSRPLICEPDLPRRLLFTPDKRTSKCTSCNKCLKRISTQPLKCVEFDEFQQVVRKL